MRKYVLMSLCLLFALFSFAPSASAESVRKELKLIMEGNKLYNSGQYRLALKKYQEALEKNGASKSGRYNLGLTQIRLGSNPADTTPQAKSLLQEGQKNLQAVAQLGGENPKLASMANYNLGNVAFNAEDYQSALSYYKQSLRLNPADNAAKRNLRITQLKLQNQNQNQDQNQDKNQDQNQDKNEDKNEDKDQNQDQNQDQNKDQNQDKQDQQQNQPKEQDINQQTADQILQAMENKENQTRARVGKGNNGEKSRGHTKRRKNW